MNGPMRFEARELKPYSEPVRVEELQEGRVYFAVNFLDTAMLIPTMEPVVFIGRNLEPGDVERFYFQDADSYRQGIRYGTGVAEDDATFYSAPHRATFSTTNMGLIVYWHVRCVARGQQVRSASQPAFCQYESYRV